MPTPDGSTTLPEVRPFYDDGLITIYHGDCREIVPRLPRVDLLLTDPPYGINVCRRGTIGSDPTVRSRRRHQVAARCTQFGAVTWDSAPPDPWVLQMLMSHAKTSILWGGNYYPGMPRATCWLVWDKRTPKGVGWADAELAWTSIPKAVRMFRWRWSGMLQEDMSRKETRVHPTQKPVPLMEWCLSRVSGVTSVLDPFVGAGSTLIAAQRAGIRAIGIDQHEPYLASAVARLLADKEERAREAEPKTAVPFLADLGGSLLRPGVARGREGSPPQGGPRRVRIPVPQGRRQDGGIRPAQGCLKPPSIPPRRRHRSGVSGHGGSPSPRLADRAQTDARSGG